MLSKIRNLIAVPSLAALLLTTLVSSPAGATTPGRTGSSLPAAKPRKCANGKPTRIFRDSRGDAENGIDIDGLGVWNKDADRCYWTTVTGHFGKKRAQVIQVFYDTNRRRSGAEYQAWSYSPKDRSGNRWRGKADYVPNYGWTPLF